MFMLQAKVKAIHVPYKGSGPMLTDLIGGQIQYSFDTMTAATPHVKSGKAIAIAQTRLKRAKGLSQRADDGTSPASPASRPPPGTAWRAPARCRPPMAKRMNEDVNKVLPCPT